MLEVIDHFEQAGLEAEATAVHDLVRVHIEEDPRREFGNEEFAAAYDALRGYIQRRPAEVRALWLPHRASSGVRRPGPFDR